MRTYTKFTSDTAQVLLAALADTGTDPGAYQRAMTDLGKELAATIAHDVLPSLASQSLVCVVCTVEDADFLARGLMDGLAKVGVSSDRLKLACFWNERVRSFIGSDERAFDIAPVIKQYREATDLQDAVVVVVKSIISGACVVKTNLATLIETAVPSKVIVAAPVMYKGAEQRLAQEFPTSISQRFEYLTYAIDDEKAGDNVVPGIGGQVYDRLGFEEKNTYVPQLVKERRQLLSA